MNCYSYLGVFLIKLQKLINLCSKANKILQIDNFVVHESELHLP